MSDLRRDVAATLGRSGVRTLIRISLALILGLLVGLGAGRYGTIGSIQRGSLQRRS